MSEANSGFRQICENCDRTVHIHCETLDGKLRCPDLENFDGDGFKVDQFFVLKTPAAREHLAGVREGGRLVDKVRELARNEDEIAHYSGDRQAWLAAGYNEALKDVLYIIENAADPVGAEDWVPCAERLPEEETTYLFWTQVRPTPHLLNWRRSLNKYWVRTNYSHWRPLPAPPVAPVSEKGKEDE